MKIIVKAIVLNLLICISISSLGEQTCSMLSLTGDALKAYNTLNSYGGWVTGSTAHGNIAGDPKGFVTILLFDKNYNFLDAAWDQLDASYVQNGVVTKNAFGYLTREVTIKEEGYAYVYINNERPTFVDIYAEQRYPIQ